MAQMPISVRDITKSSAQFESERARPVLLAVWVEIDAADELIDALKEALRPQTAGARLTLEVIEPGRVCQVLPGTDALVAVAGSGGSSLRQALGEADRSGTRAAVVALGEAADVPRLADALARPLGDVIVRPEADEVLRELGQWLSDTVASKRLSLAHNFLFMRRAVAEDAVGTAAWQNALIGAVTVIPGADMPLMTANQAKMLLQIAAAYGQPLGIDRVKELVAVVGGGFLFRALARQALSVVPVLGWAVKGGIGYTGTLAMGHAAISYFEEGADVGHVAARLRALAKKHGRLSGAAKAGEAANLSGDLNDDITGGFDTDGGARA